MRRERGRRQSIVGVLVALVVAGTTAVVAVPPVAALPNNTISGVVTDGDVGVPASGLEVRLYREPGRVVVGNRTTAVDGSYSFSGLEDGSYRLRLADPTTGTFGTEFFADKAVYSAATAVNVAGGASTTANATVTRPTQIAGVVRDADTASPVPGIEVRLYREPGRVFVANRTTAADGSYVFADPGAGTYRLRFQDPAGVYVTEFHADMPYYSKASDVVVAPGASVAVDAAISAPTSISGAVTDDLTGQPVPGIEVRLYEEPGRVVVANATTAADGSYAFSNPGAGTYRLRFQDPAGRYVTEFFDGASTYSPGTDILLPVGGDAVASAALVRPESTYVVNTAADGGDAAIDGVCAMTPGLGDCSLRAAFDEANAHPGHDVVQIAGGVHPVLALPGVGEDANAAGDLDVTADVDLAGGGATIDGGGLDRVLHVHSGASVTATDLTVTGGYLDDPASVYGGGVLTEGELTLERVVVTGNEIADPDWSFGGGVASLGYEPGAGLVVIDSTIAANEAAHGAGVTVETGTFSVSRSSIVDNVPHGNLAGGVVLIGTTGTIDRSTVARNGSAPAVFVGADPDLDNPVASDVSIRQSTVEGQSAGIYGVDSLVDVIASTVVGLQVENGGAALLLDDTTVEIAGSILDGDGGSCWADPAAVTSGGWNVSDDATCALTGPGDRQDATVLLHALAGNGGPTQTRLAYANSETLDVIPIGTPGLCDGSLATDQRGAVRPSGSACDAGAVEGDTGAPALPMTFVVDTTMDGADAMVGDGVCDVGDGHCSLRAAIDESNARPSTDTVELPGASTIALSLTGSDEDANATGDLDILDDLVLAGNDATIDAAGLDRAVDHRAGLLVADDLTITGGMVDQDGGGLRSMATVDLTGVSFVGNTAAANGKGGGAMLWSGTLRDGVVSGNAAKEGGGIWAANTTVTASTIAANTATRQGGGIIGSVTLEATSVTDNTVTSPVVGAGGGLYLFGSSTISRSTIARNSALSGGGIHVVGSGQVTIERSTISGNSATSGAAIRAYPSGSMKPMIVLVGSTVAANDGAASLQTSITVPAFDLRGSVVDATPWPACSGPLPISGGHNVVSDATCGISGAGDVTDVAPMLHPLADNGGPTETHLPAAGSPAIDAIPSGATGLCDAMVTSDQRGEARPTGSACDIGAVEGVGPTVARTFVVDDPGDVPDADSGDGSCDTGGGVCTLRAAIDEVSSGLGADRIELAPGINPVIALGGTGEDANASGDLDVLEAVTIDGNGATIDGAGLDRVLDLRYAPTRLQELTVRGGVTTTTGAGIRSTGSLDLADVTVADNRLTAGGQGAGVWAGGGTLTVSGSIFDGNEAASSTSNAGVGLFIGTTTAVVSTSSFNDNHVIGTPYGSGGGLVVDGGHADISDTSFTGNGASKGGAVAVTSNATATISGSTITGNEGTTGGGVHATSDTTVTIVDSSIEGNHSYDAGGAHLAGSATLERVVVRDNAIDATTGTVGVAVGAATITRSTIAAAPSQPGMLVGVATTPGTLLIDSSTLVREGGSGAAVFRSGATLRASTVVSTAPGDVLVGSSITLQGSIVSVDARGDSCSSPAISGGWNVLADASCELTGPGDQQGVDPLVGSLGDHGGPTPTVLAAANSPAIDRIPPDTPSLCHPDQRDVARPFGAACDAGAVEGAGPSMAPLMLTVTSAGDAADAVPGDGSCVTVGGTCTLRAAIDEANRWPLPDTISIQPGVRPVLSLTPASEDNNVGGDLDVWSDIVIDGNGMVVDGAQIDRVFDQSAGTMRLEDMTVRRGRVDGSGGGIRSTSSNLALSNVTVRSNTTDTDGGGLFTSGGSLTVEGGSFLSNRVAATGFGAAITSFGTVVDINGAVITDNQIVRVLSWMGNAVYLSGGSATIVDTTVRANVGGGVWADVSSGRIERSSLIDNAPKTGAAGLRASSALEIVDTTVSEPVEVAVDLQGATLTSSTVLGTTTGSGVVRGSILDGGEVSACTSFRPSSGGHNLVSDASCAFGAAGDLDDTDPLLWPLTDEGPGRIVARPAANGAAVDAIPTGTAGLCDGSVPLDQLGAPRPDGAGCDVGAVEGPGPAVTPQTYVVDTSADLVPVANGGTGCATSDGSCSLRAAITTANLHPGPDTVEIVPGVHPELSLAGSDDTNAAGDLDITRPLTLEGNGATVDANGIDRVFDLAGSGGTLRDVTITGGAAPAGGGLVATRDLVLDHVTVAANGSNAAVANGGGILMTSGSLTMVDSTLRDNVVSASSGRGGGLYLGAVDAVIDRSTFSGNVAGATSGAIEVGPWTDLALRQSTLVGNAAPWGSAMSSWGNPKATVTIVSSTITAGTGSTVLDNGGPVTMVGSIITAPSGSEACDDPVTSGGFNIASDASCGLAGAGDQQGVDPLLDVLGDNGGPTWTRRPADGSPAIDAIPIGTVGLCDGTSPTDQRGVARPQGGGCDIGAVDR